MTMRERTASMVDTYVRPDTSRVTATAQRGKQIAGVFQQLGVNISKERAHRKDELAKRTQAATENAAMLIEARTRPQIEEAMRDPAFYKDAEGRALTPEAFLKSDAYRLGADAIEQGGIAPEHSKLLLQQYQQRMLGKFASEQAKHQHEELKTHSSLAQEVGAQEGNVVKQLRAFDNSLTQGVSRDDAFAAGLASAILAGPEYLKEFAKARNWTPEEDLKIKGELKRMADAAKAKKDAAFGYLNRMKGLTGLLNHDTALKSAYALRDTKAHMMEPQELGGLLADIDKLEEKGRQYDAVAEALENGVSVQRLYGQYADLSNTDVDDVNNQRYLQAKSQGLTAEIEYLRKNPHSLPKTYTAELQALYGSFGALDINNPEEMGLKEAAWKRHSQIMEELGPRTVDMVFQRDAGRAFVFDAKVRNLDFKRAVASAQKWDENAAMNGGVGLRVDKKDADKITKSIFSSMDIPDGQQDVVEAKINAILNDARQYGIRDKDDLTTLVEKELSHLFVDGVPDAMPFLEHISEFYPEEGLDLKQALSMVRSQAGLGGLELPADAVPYFDPTNPRMVYFADKETGQALTPQPLDAYATLGEYMHVYAPNKTSRKESNINAVRERAARRERTDKWLIERGYR